MTRTAPERSRRSSRTARRASTPAVVGDAAIHGTATGAAFHIQTNVPVVAYQMLPYGGGRARVTGVDAPLADERVGHELRRRRRVPSLRTIASCRKSAPARRRSIIASQDGTNVTVKPTADHPPGRRGRGRRPRTSSRHLQARPGAVPAAHAGGGAHRERRAVRQAGRRHRRLDADGRSRDHASRRQRRADAPAGARARQRVRRRALPQPRAGDGGVVPWRIVGAVDGTALTFEPPPPPGRPPRSRRSSSAEFDAPGPFVVRSQDAQHPFYFASAT